MIDKNYTNGDSNGKGRCNYDSGDLHRYSSIFNAGSSGVWVKADDSKAATANYTQY
jgi:hypothetical protein